jgi:hypothetical protein
MDSLALPCPANFLRSPFTKWIFGPLFIHAMNATYSMDVILYHSIFCLKCMTAR